MQWGKAITIDGLHVLNFSPSLAFCREHTSEVYNFIITNNLCELCDSLHCCQYHCCAENTLNMFEKMGFRQLCFGRDFSEQFSLCIDRLDEHSYSQCPINSILPDIKNIPSETICWDYTKALYWVLMLFNSCLTSAQYLDSFRH